MNWLMINNETGEEIEVKNLVEFAEEHSLNPNHLSQTYTGEMNASDNDGWTAHYLGDEDDWIEFK